MGAQPGYTLQRFGLVTPFAAAITATLFLLLVVMTAARNDYFIAREVQPPPKFKPIDPNIDRTPTPPRPTPPPPPVTNTLPVLPLPPFVPVDPPDRGIVVTPGRYQLPPGEVDPIRGGSDSVAPRSIIVPRPEYPESARRRGIEGFAIVEFTVTAAGTTRDAHIVRVEPAGYFEKAALFAAQRARYQPALIEGRPVETPGVQYRFVFNFED